MSHHELLKALEEQHIGIIPHDNSDYIKYTIPNKIFDYMAHSLPIIVPSVKPLKRVVEETSSGLNDNRKKLESLLMDESIKKIVVEHSDRFSRFGMNYIEKLLKMQGRR